MLIPCIDLQGGHAVQLVHGRKRDLAVADVFGLLKKFKSYRWLHVIDLDAAMGKGDNDELVRELCNHARKQLGTEVRVGGGIRTVSRAREIGGWDASQMIVGSAAFRNGKVNTRFLRQLSQKNPSKTNHHCPRHRQRKHHHPRAGARASRLARKSNGAAGTLLHRFPLH